MFSGGLMRTFLGLGWLVLLPFLAMSCASPPGTTSELSAPKHFDYLATDNVEWELQVSLPLPAEDFVDDPDRVNARAVTDRFCILATRFFSQLLRTTLMDPYYPGTVKQFPLRLDPYDPVAGVLRFVLEVSAPAAVGNDIPGALQAEDGSLRFDLPVRSGFVTMDPHDLLFWNPAKQGEAEPVSVILQRQLRTSTDAYPPYDRMFEGKDKDHPLTIAVFFGAQALYFGSRFSGPLSRMGFTPEPGHPDEDYNTQAKTMRYRGREVGVRVYHYNESSFAKGERWKLRDKFEQRLLDSDIFVYYGHSNLGSGPVLAEDEGGDIEFGWEDFRRTAERDRRGRYQLLVMISCNSYQYYSDNLLSLENFNVVDRDIITTSNVYYPDMAVTEIEATLAALLRTKSDGEHDPASFAEVLEGWRSDEAISPGVHGVDDNPRTPLGGFASTFASPVETLHGRMVPRGYLGTGTLQTSPEQPVRWQLDPPQAGTYVLHAYLPSLQGVRHSCSGLTRAATYRLYDLAGEPVEETTLDHEHLRLRHGDFARLFEHRIEPGYEVELLAEDGGCTLVDVLGLSYRGTTPPAAATITPEDPAPSDDLGLLDPPLLDEESDLTSDTAPEAPLEGKPHLCGALAGQERGTSALVGMFLLAAGLFLFRRRSARQ